MTHHAKAPSAGSTETTGSSRGLFGRAVATRGGFSNAKGSGAPSSRRARTTLAALALAIAVFAVTAAPASAAPPSIKMGAISNVSYTSAHVTGFVTSDGSGAEFSSGTSWGAQYSTDPSDPTKWVIGYQTTFANRLEGAFTDKPVETDPDITGLKGGTKYFVRLVANNGGFLGAEPEVFSPEPYASFTTLAVDPPTIPGAVEASPVFSTSAKATAKVKRPANPASPGPGVDAAFDVNCRFEYISDDQYKANELATEPLFTGATPVPCTPNPIKQADAGIDKDVFAQLIGLSPSTTYHLRLVAENAAPGGPVVKEAAGTFTTVPKVAAPTVTVVNDASQVKYNTATLTGKVLRPDGADPALNVNCHFEYVTEAAFQPLSEQQKLTLTNATGGTFTLSFAGETTTPIAFDASAAQVQGALESLSSIGTGNVSVSGAYTIDFTGSLADKDVEQIFADPSALEEAGVASAETATVTEGHVGGFENPSTVDCAENPITAAKVDVDGEIAVSAKPGLAANTKYHLRLVAENEGGSDTMLAANTFTTPEAELPIVTIDPVEGGTFTVAHVSGTVECNDPGDCPLPTDSGTAFVEFSTDNVNWIPLGSGGEGRSNITPAGYDIDWDVTGLQPSTTYFFRIGASYRSGVGRDEIIANGEMAFSPEPNPSITTEPPQAPPTAENLAITDVTATTAHFSGTVNPNAPPGPLSGPAKKAYATKWHFECAPECKDINGNEIGGTVQGEEGPQTVTGDVKRLDPDTEYEVRLIVSNVGGGETVVETFNTPLIKPTVKASLGGSDGKGGYTLQATVNPNGSNVSDCKFEWGPNSADYAFTADCSPTPGDKAQPVSVEAHLTGLNPGVVYHYNLLATNGAGTSESGDQEFTPTLSQAESCSNEQQRAESNSLALSECRAYEMVTPPGKEGFGALLETFDGGIRVAYGSGAGNIAKSGQNAPAPLHKISNQYVAVRSPSGWETIPNLNGSSGSLRDAPLNVDTNTLQTNRLAYSEDLLSSVWSLHRQGEPEGIEAPVAHLRSPGGTFSIVGNIGTGNGGLYAGYVAFSGDLSHLVNWAGVGGSSKWGPGVYEFLGTGMDLPRRVDLDNSGSPISTCVGTGETAASNAVGRSVSRDGSRIVNYVFGGCGGANPPADELWARVNGTTAVDVSASHCNRVAPPACNAPSNPTFTAATPDGSRVFFTTTQQLINADTDQTRDIYACDIPAGNPAPTADNANHCSSFMQISGPGSNAQVEEPTFGSGKSPVASATVSENGATAVFVASGVLDDDEDALGEKAVAGDHNLYVWRADASHPNGQTAFVGRLGSNDLISLFSFDNRVFYERAPQATPDGRYLVFTTASRLVDTDTDTARDVYRYDADTGELTRISTNVFGVGGNGDAFPAAIADPTEHHPATSISADGQKIVFTTTEALSPVDGNAEPDVYLWTPTRVSLISTGSSGFAPRGTDGLGNSTVLNPGVAIDPAGENIYFESAQPLTPADGDSSTDVYDARIGGGFSFTSKPVCTGEKCQPDATPAPPKKAPLSAQPGPGNPTPPKPCPKGKIRKKNGKCAKKPKKHSAKQHHGKKHKRAGSNTGGGK